MQWEKIMFLFRGVGEVELSCLRERGDLWWPRLFFWTLDRLEKESEKAVMFMLPSKNNTDSKVFETAKLAVRFVLTFMIRIVIKAVSRVQLIVEPY